MQDESIGVDDGFGHWLAGFVNGEGCFNIGMWARTKCIRITFNIALRNDDAAILEEIHRRTGLGTLQRYGARGRSQAQVRWSVCNKRDCVRLVEIFDRYPLRAKKARDFAIWREAVHEWVRIPYYPRVNRRGSRIRDWGRLETLMASLKATRAYDAEQREVVVSVPSPPDLSLFEEVA